MTRSLTKAEAEKFADVRGAAEQARWFVTNQYVGGGGGADVLLAMRASDLDALHSAYAAVPTTWGESLAQVIAERFVSGRDVLAAIKIPRLRSPRIKAWRRQSRRNIRKAHRRIALRAGAPPRRVDAASSVTLAAVTASRA